MKNNWLRHQRRNTWRLCFFMCIWWHVCPAQYANPAFSDLHNSVLYRIFQQQRMEAFADTAYPVSIQALQKANSQLVVLSIGIPEFGFQSIGIEEILAFLRQFRLHCERVYPQIAFVNSQRSLSEALANKQMAVAYNLEGSHLLEGKTHYIDSLKDAGLVMMGMAHWYSNGFFVSKNKSAQRLGIAKIDSHTRLSGAGKALLRKLIREGIFIDVSHAGQQMLNQVLRINRGRTKIMASHANAQAVCNIPRNFSDAQLRKIAQTGGLIGICLHGPMLGENPTIETAVQHIQHLAKIVGVAHICIGSDFEGNTLPPKGLEGIEQMEGLAAALSESGFTDQEIYQIMSGNVLTIWK